LDIRDPVEHQHRGQRELGVSRPEQFAFPTIDQFFMSIRILPPIVDQNRRLGVQWFNRSHAVCPFRATIIASAASK
jgi:hypothetical protein